MMQDFVLIDYLLLAIIALSVLIGLWRGFLREFISLATWVAAFVIAFLFAEDASLYLVPYIGVPSARAVLAFGGLFLVTLILGGLINMLISQLVRSTGLSGTDRLIGFVFGGVRAAALIAVLILLAILTPLPQDPWWQESVLIPYFEPLAMWLRDQLPAEFAEPFVFPGEVPVEPPPVEPPADPAVAPPAAPATTE
jgi:membrane protein required for colicin V production